MTKQRALKFANQKSIVNLLDEFPTIETMMFKNKSAIRLHKKKKSFKNKPR